MKITSVETFPLIHFLSLPYGDANGYKHYRSLFLIRIRTSSGLEGWGEVVDYLPTLERGFRERIIPYLLGQPWTSHLKIVKTLSKWHARSAVGVSMALTEITAKYAGLSICDLWGGCQTTSVPLYASLQSYTEQPDWIRHSLTQVTQAASHGFYGVKVKIGGRSLSEDQQHIQQLIQALQGQVPIALDANQSYDVSTALRWNHFYSQDQNWMWLEEPLSLDHVHHYGSLRKKTPFPIAGGENLTSPTAFLPFLQNESLDLIQPDLSHMESLDAFRDTLKLARTFGIRTSPHAFDGVLSRYYAILAQSCLPNWSKMDSETVEPVEWDVMENPFSTLLSIQPQNGSISIPQTTGLGLEWDFEKILAYRWNGLPY